MTVQKKHILFIGHEATLTGAPILLLNLLGLIKDDYHFSIILKRGGTLEQSFKQLSSTIILKGENYSKSKNIILFVFERCSFFIKQLSLIPLFFKADIIFSNTICNGRLLKRFNFFKRPTIVYVHELESMLKYFNLKNDTTLSLQLAKILLCPSKKVLENLRNNHQVNSLKLKLFPYYFKSDQFQFTSSQKIDYRNAFLEKWNIPTTAKLVCGMGMVSERKGTDLFVSVAKQVFGVNENIYFVWIGDFSEEEISKKIELEYHSKKYPDRLVFTGKLPYATTNLLPFDLFFLSSKEDPYPLVVLEAALQNVPSLCYEKSGGIVEFIGYDAGFIIDSLESNVISNKIIEILKDDEQLTSIALRCKEKVLELHSNANNISNQFNDVITSVLK